MKKVLHWQLLHPAGHLYFPAKLHSATFKINLFASYCTVCLELGSPTIFDLRASWAT